MVHDPRKEVKLTTHGSRACPGATAMQCVHRKSNRGSYLENSRLEILFTSGRLCVEAGKNASTVIPESRKRRQKGNPVVSDETVPADLRKG
jgi:hypothetical protein